MKFLPYLNFGRPAFLLLLLMATNLQAQLIFKEDFTQCTNVTNQGWSAFTNQNQSSIGGCNTSLMYAGYSGSNVGNSASLFQVDGEGVEHVAASTLGDVYVGFLMNVSTANTSGALVMNFNTNGTGNYENSGFTLDNNNFGLTNGVTPTYAASTFSNSTTYLLVVRLSNSTGAYRLYIDPTLGGTEPVTPSATVTPTGTKPTLLYGLRIYQKNVTQANIDGIRVGKTWADIVGGGAGGGLLLTETFSNCGDVSSNGWTYYNSCCISSCNPALNYPGYSNSTGNSAQINFTTSAAFKSFPAVSSGNVYAGFLVNVNNFNSNPNAGNLNFYSSSAGNNFNYQQGFVTDNSNDFGVRYGSGGAQIQDAPTFVNSFNTYLVVLGYNIDTDQYSLWINPPTGSLFPSGPDVTVFGNNTVSFIDGISLAGDGSDNLSIDDIQVSTNWADVVTYTPPTTQPTNLFLTSSSTTNVNGNFTTASGNPNGYLVLRSETIPPTTLPVNGFSYGIGTPLGNATVVSNSSSTNFNEFSLSAGTTYYYTIYAYNNLGGYVYNTTAPLQGIVATDVNGPPTALTFSSVQDTQMNVSFTAAPAPVSGYVVFRNSGCCTTSTVDGISYAVGDVVSGWTVVYNGSGTSFTDTGLSANTTYYYDIYSYSGLLSHENYVNSSLNGNRSTLATSPTAQPTVLAFSNRTTNSMTVGFTAATGSPSGYLIMTRPSISPTNAAPVDGTTYSIGNSLGGGTVAAVGSGTSFGVTGLPINTQNYFDIYSYNGSGATINYYYLPAPLEGSAYSLIAEPTAQPSAITFNALTSSSFNVAFTAASPVPSGGYIALRSASAVVDTPVDGTTYIVGNTIGSSTVAYIGTALTFSQTSLTPPGTTYHYKIFSYGLGSLTTENYFTGGAPPFNSTTTLANTPVANAAASITQTSFTASWGVATGATGYRLDVATDAGFSSLVAGYNNLTVAGTSSPVTGLSSGINYWYRVRSVNSAGAPSPDSNAPTLLTIPPNPVSAVATVITQTSFSANWGTATSATNYILDVTTDPGFTAHISGSPISVGNFLTRSVTGLSMGTTYYYQVRAANATGTSGNSGSQTLITIPSNPVSSAATAVAQTSFSANWAASTGAASYRLDVSTSNVFGSFVTGYSSLNVGSVTTYSVNTNLTAGTTYYYRVRAVNTGGTSFDSGTQSLITVPPNPVSLAATAIAQTSFSANWGSSTGATAYLLDVSISSVFASFVTGYNNLLLGNVTTYSVNTNLTGGTTYYYRVRATNTIGVTFSGSSGNQSLTTIPPDPVSSAPTAIAQTSFSANWGASTGATAYLLDVSTSNIFGSFVTGYNNLNVGNVTSYSVNTNLTAGTTYYYRVRATNTAGATFSGNSGSQTLNTIPPNPVSSVATSITNTSFSANWGASTGATAYLLDVATDNGFTLPVSGYTNLNVGNVTTYSVTSLTTGIAYYYRVRATNTAGVTFSGNSATQNLTTAPPVPVASAATAITQVSFSANWATSSGATGYILDVSTSNVFGSFVTGYNNLNVGNVLTYPVNTNLIAGTTYYYRVRASNGGGTSASSSTISLATTSPVATAATAMAQTAFTTNWTAATNATNYRLDVATDAGFTSFVSGYNDLLTGNVVTRNVNTGLSAGITYYYRIRVVTAVGTSGNSNTITTQTIPPDPVSTAATAVAQTSFSANWGASTGATAYLLDVSTSNVFGSFVTGYNNLNVGSVTSYAVNTNLTAGTTYYYRVRATNTSGVTFSGNSGSQSLITSPPNPVSSVASPITQTSFSANWAAATSATSYVVDVTTDAGFTLHVAGSPFSPGNVFILSVTGLAGGTTYFYQIRAVNAGGTSGNSSAQTLITVPPNPVATAATATTASTMTVNWNASLGAASYKLDVATDAGFTSFVSSFNDITVNATSSALTGLSANSTYYYRVRAVNTSGTSLSSNTISQLTLTAAPVATAASSVSPAGFTANWSATTGATSYQLDVASDAGFGSLLASFNNLAVAGTNSSVIGLIAGTTYYYRVRSVNATGASVNSNVISQITVPPVPVATDPTLITTSSFTANWVAVTGADSYRLDVSSDNFSTFVAGFNNLSVMGTSFLVAGLSEGITYKYQVRAVNSGGTSASSNSISLITVPPVPTAQAATGITTTTFTANWTSVSGGTSYVLDVSTDNFSTFLTGYNGKSLTATSEVITGLQPNYTYQYRVRANSASGTSANSNVISVLTFSSTPVANAATSPGQTGFTANWNSISGITNFALDVSADDFSTLLTGYSNLTVTGTSKVVTSLTPGVVYKYRLRAVNATGASSNSNAIAIITIPATPVANIATGISQTGFTINWTAVGGLDNYLLDVSLNNSFSSFITGYAAKSINSATTIEDLLGLEKGTTYFYRVRSVNASGASGNSNTISQITIPSTPIPNTVQNATNNSFIASWNSIQGVDHYELDVTLVSSNFGTFVSGYNARVVDGTETEEVVVGLSAGTSYYFRLRAVNNGGESPNSTRKAASTTGVVAPFAVTLTSTNNQFTGTSITVPGQISNAIGDVTAILVYKGITETATKEKVIEVSGGSYSVTIDETMFDDLGVEFFVRVRDETDVEKITPTERIYRTFTSVSVPAILSGSLEGTRASIKIISIPYDLKDNLIQSIFSSLGVYDKKSWRLAHFQEGQNVEYEAGINKIERGQGYWFNAKAGALNIKPGEASVGIYNTSNPFKLSLVQGWNQIGNPFPFPIDWSDVLADNASIAGVGPLRVYNGANENYAAGDNLKEFTGGFVFSDKAVTLNIAVTLKGKAGRKAKPTESQDLGQPTWQVPFTITQNNSSYNLGAIGMHPEASDSKDQWDEIRLPRLDEFLDVTFDHPEYRLPTGQAGFTHFTKDIVTTAIEQSWKFSIESSGTDELGLLEWSNTAFGSNSAQLVLLDVEATRFIDMRLRNNYSFTNPGKKEFRVYYRNDGKPVVPDVLIIGAPYPNPSSESIRTTLLLPESSNPFDVELTAFNLLGQPVKTLVSAPFHGGVHEVSWDGNDVTGTRVPAGIYILKAKINSRSINQLHKVVMK